MKRQLKPFVAIITWVIGLLILAIISYSSDHGQISRPPSPAGFIVSQESPISSQTKRAAASQANFRLLKSDLDAHLSWDRLSQICQKANQRLQTFAKGADFSSQMVRMFCHESTDLPLFNQKVELLRQAILSDNLEIPVTLLPNRDLQGHPACFIPASSTREAKIILNSYWLDADLMSHYLSDLVLHETGHAIDHLLNEQCTDIWDKGDLFMRTLNGERFDPESLANLFQVPAHSPIFMDGVKEEAECASVTFLTVYPQTAASTSSVSFSSPLVGSSFKFTSVNPADVSFTATGNDVAGQLTYTAGGLDLYINGIITKSTTSGSNDLAFYFVETTTLGGSSLTGKGWMLVIPGKTITSPVNLNNSFKYSDLNSFLTSQSSNAAPIITSNNGGATAIVSLAENTAAVTKVVGSDSNLPASPYSITGGADYSLFTIDAATGNLSFATGKVPNYELPTDVGANNVYEVQVTVTDSQGATDSQDISVEITNVNDETPVITSNGGGTTATISVVQNTTAVTTVTATDSDNGDVLTYSLQSGTYSGLFSIDGSSGVLQFKTGAAVGSYSLVVVVTDAGGRSDTQTLTIQVTSSDTTAPTLVISASDTKIAKNETATITFNFSEEVKNFTVDDVNVTGGTLSNFAKSGSVATQYTALFTPDNLGTTPVFTVNASTYQDLNDNNGLSATLSLEADIIPPTVTVDIEGTAIAYGETRIVTFTFSEAPGNTFSIDDLTVTNGLLTDLSVTTDAKVWKAALKSTNAKNGPTVTVKSASYKDAAGNDGSSGTDTSTISPPSIGLSNGSDSGLSSYDDITNVVKPILVGSAAQSDYNGTATVKVTASDGKIYTYSSVPVNSVGEWTLDLSTATTSAAPSFPSSGLPSGYVSLEVIGNTSLANAKSSFFIDTTKPAAPTLDALTTVDATPTITGTATLGDGDLITVTINSYVYTSGDGYLTYNKQNSTWSLTIPEAHKLSLGSNSVLITLTDQAGNTNSYTGSVTIATSTITIDLANTATDDTGYSSTDNITSNTKPSISGTASSDATVTITVTANGVVYTYNNVAVTLQLFSLNLSTTAPSSVSPTGNFPTAGLPSGSVSVGVTGNSTSKTATNTFQVYNKIWIGTSSDWTSASNWSPSGAPTSTDDILISQGSSYPVITGSVTAKNVILDNNCTLTIAPNAFVTVTNKLTNN
ncbi:MAG: Ig-like domain-containing protein, partial [Marinilabiliales bacterium]|nr:Ig-like domain-containing protein [Marinilabiliales bacterium]